MAGAVVTLQKAANITQMKGIKMSFGTIALDDSYPTGGEAITPADLGLAQVFALIAFPTAGYVPEWDGTNKKLKMYWADYDAAADGALVEVANTTNLSALAAIPFIALGW